MPIPQLRFDNRHLGEPSQRVPLRYAFFVTGLAFTEFLSLLIDPVDRYDDPADGSSHDIYLDVQEYCRGEERTVRPQTYEGLRKAALAGAPIDDLLRRIPTNHFVWSHLLADVFRRYMRFCRGYEDWVPPTEDLCWNPALLGRDALIEECVDLSDLGAGPGSAPSGQQAYLFRRSKAGGWDIRFEGHPCGPFKDSRGFHYIRHLLQNPSKSVSAIELSALVQQPRVTAKQQAQAEAVLSVVATDDDDDVETAETLNISLGGHAGEVIDQQALTAYKAQYKELQAALDEAQEFGDAEKSEKIRDEMGFLTREISQATRPGGRIRREKPTSKRAYDAVDKAIQRAIADLAKHCPALAGHLNNAIAYQRADGWCYRPQDKIDWKF